MDGQAGRWENKKYSEAKIPQDAGELLDSMRVSYKDGIGDKCCCVMHEDRTYARPRPPEMRSCPAKIPPEVSPGQDTCRSVPERESEVWSE